MPLTSTVYEPLDPIATVLLVPFASLTVTVPANGEPAAATPDTKVDAGTLAPELDPELDPELVDPLDVDPPLPPHALSARPAMPTSRQRLRLFTSNIAETSPRGPGQGPSWRRVGARPITPRHPFG